MFLMEGTHLQTVKTGKCSTNTKYHLP